ncbi:two-component system response regulator FixJ [Brevundimonas vesicularis]|uniref:Two-component system response regulator FixJ n=1 Tax=Brevundimonas vesicularis TaxID=41276 RepID=A0A7W9FV64_BREVE|nr:response regulator FixJ [Brevundimonas vesicularis]MBB5772133.1 two-component system response regulator FixJ [Brevundimonas vesicularis]
MSPHSVFIIDDDPAMRDALVLMLRGAGYRARSFVSADDFLTNLPEDRSACVITDVRMPGLQGSELVGRLKSLRGDTWPVIVITGHGEVTLAVELMKAGVVDFVEKPFDPQRMLDAVSSCLASLTSLEAERIAREDAKARLDTLTPRERQVFDALIDGCSNKEIAQRLEISPRTVEIFRAKVMTKMQAANLSTLVRIGMRASDA